MKTHDEHRAGIDSSGTQAEFVICHLISELSPVSPVSSPSPCPRVPASPRHRVLPSPLSPNPQPYSQGDRN
ncbi:MAG: hypothetical protein SWY16_24560 [Cyanobacteriota bacterium]|nr:hypothetical protein [Cyanobacteriota bacterium]